MSQLKLSIATTDYDHFRDFRMGLVKAEGIDHNWLTLGHHEIFARQTFNREFDVSELSFAKFSTQITRDDCDIVGRVAGASASGKPPLGALTIPPPLDLIRYEEGTSPRLTYLHFRNLTRDHLHVRHSEFDRCVCQRPCRTEAVRGWTDYRTSADCCAARKMEPA